MSSLLPSILTSSSILVIQEDYKWIEMLEPIYEVFLNLIFCLQTCSVIFLFAMLSQSSPKNFSYYNYCLILNCLTAYLLEFLMFLFKPYLLSTGFHVTSLGIIGKVKNPTFNYWSACFLFLFAIAHAIAVLFSVLFQYLHTGNSPKLSFLKNIFYSKYQFYFTYFIVLLMSYMLIAWPLFSVNYDGNPVQSLETIVQKNSLDKTFNLTQNGSLLVKYLQKDAEQARLKFNRVPNDPIFNQIIIQNFENFYRNRYEFNGTQFYRNLQKVQVFELFLNFLIRNQNRLIFIPVMKSYIVIYYFFAISLFGMLLVWLLYYTYYKEYSRLIQRIKTDSDNLKSLRLQLTLFFSIIVQTTIFVVFYICVMGLIGTNSILRFPYSGTINFLAMFMLNIYAPISQLTTFYFVKQFRNQFRSMFYVVMNHQQRPRKIQPDSQSQTQQKMETLNSSRNKMSQIVT